MEDTPVADTWDLGERYEQYVGRWSRQVAPLFVSWLRIPAGRRWVDVGCGTGALCQAILDRCSPSAVIGIEPSEGFLETAKEKLSGRAEFRRGTATDIPLNDSTVDVAVSGLVLNFVEDPRAAVVEMARVAGNEGGIGAYVWDYAGRMEFMRVFWDAAVELRPEAKSKDEGIRFPVCRREALVDLFAGAGLRGIHVTAIDIPTRFANFEEYWRPFLGGQGPAPSYVASLDDSARGRLRDRLRERLPAGADGSISLTARAWALRGTVAK